MPASWEQVELGRTGVHSSAIGLGASFGLDARDVERAFERGINYFYWGSMRRPAFGRAVRTLAQSHREQMVVVIQSYARSAVALRVSLEAALRRLRLDYADFLLLGWWNQPPSRRIRDAAVALCEAGKARHLMVSCHNRPAFEQMARDDAYGAIMVRYNAAHRGAEREVFPVLGARPPGVVSYTATRWGALIDPKQTPPGEPTPRASDCYRFVLANPHVDMCLSGPANAAQLDEAMAALDRGPMDEQELAWMRRVGDAVHASAGKPWRNPGQVIELVASTITGGRGRARR